MASPTRCMSLSRLQEVVKDREARRAAVHGVTKSHDYMNNNRLRGEGILPLSQSLKDQKRLSFPENGFESFKITPRRPAVFPEWPQ